MNYFKIKKITYKSSYNSRRRKILEALKDIEDNINHQAKLGIPHFSLPMYDIYYNIAFRYFKYKNKLFRYSKISDSSVLISW